MTHLLAQVRLRRTSNLPEDVVVNTFHFDVPEVDNDLDQWTIITNELLDFYRVAPPEGGSPLSAYMSSVIATTGHEVRIYDMSDPEPRSPVQTTTWAFTGALSATNVAPAEVALCLTFRGASASGTNPAHRRGRIYWGPLAPSVEILNGDVRPASSMYTQLARAGNKLRTDLSPLWCVFSEVANTLTPVVSVSVDNAFDTQRRRGSDPTVRLTLPVP